MEGLYKSFTKAQFERILVIHKTNYGAGSWEDITERLEIESGVSYWEYVYALRTNQSTAKIIIYSSIDRRTNRTREKGQDRIRLIYRVESNRGVIYCKIKRHNRVENVFDTLGKTLREAHDVKSYLKRNESKIEWKVKPNP